LTAKFSQAELDSFRGTAVPDLLGADTRLLFVGINPGLWTAAVQAHFARRGNRFYPALFRAGVLDRLIDPSNGYSPEDRALLIDRGLGISNLVARATARADELTTEELTTGGQQLIRLVEQIKPRVVAVLGITAYRQAFGLRKAAVGLQPAALGGAQLWVVPNPSGLNAHASLAELAKAYRQVAQAAGLPVAAKPES
jgi:TDG/mug DNA glycosylase family protein